MTIQKKLENLVENWRKNFITKDWKNFGKFLLLCLFPGEPKGNYWENFFFFEERLLEESNQALLV